MLLGSVLPTMLQAQVTPTTTILASSSNPAITGAPVTFTATVLGASPAGTVTFMDGAETLGTAELSGPRATFMTSAMAEGEHAITAVYAGDAANGNSTSFVLQQMVSRYHGVVAVAAGGGSSAALKSDGGAVAWGDNSLGQTAIPASATSGVVGIAAGSQHMVALKSDGSVVAWGSTNSDGTTTVPAAASSGVVGIAAGYGHTVALKSDGSVVAWGRNEYGQATIPAAATSGVIAIAAGYFHTVAIKGDGSVIAWGCNDYGQATIPAAASSGVVGIAAGYAHTVALKSDGSVIAWGYNYYGQATIPAEASSGVVSIDAGYFHTVALKGDGSVIAWGYNNAGQTTIPAAATSGVVAIAAGDVHTMALKSDGSVIAWGGNYSGQATVPSFTVTVNLSGPVAAGGTIVFTGSAGGIDCTWGGEAISGTCTSVPLIKTSRVILTANLPPNMFVDTWGASCDAITGTTCTIESLAADVTISPLTAMGTVFLPEAPVIGVATANDSMASVSFDPPSSNGGGTIWWYTATSSEGQSAEGFSSPITVGGLTNGTAYTFRVTATNAAGTGTASEASNSIVPRKITSVILSSSANPVLVDDPVIFTAKVLGSNPTGTVTFRDGTDALGTEVLSGPWATFTASGLSEGQHAVTAAYEGDGVNGPSTSFVLPQNVTRYSGVKEIAAGGTHTVALKSDGSVVAWGDNSYGQTTVPAAATWGVAAIAAGTSHTMALKRDGSVIAWGDNFFDQTMIPAAATSGVVAIAAGGRNSVALKSDGSVIAWGYSYQGQTTTPAAAASGVIAVAVGAEHIVALKSDGSVIAWGSNWGGKTTIPPAATSGVVGIAAGLDHTVALKRDGSVIAWGGNPYGQTTIPATAASGVIAVAAGAVHTLALKSDGSVIAWGGNPYGQTTIPAAAASGVVAIAAGWNYSVALKGDGSVIAWGSNAGGQCAPPYFGVGVTPSGPVAPGETVEFAGLAEGIDCTWNGTSVAGSCASIALLRTSRVVLTATLPANTYIDSWGAGCDSMTGTTCTIESLESNVTISPVTVPGPVVVPDPPVIGTATAGDAEASVSFSPPVYNGGGTIWWYTVTSSGGQSASGASSPITVRGLTNGVAYTFSITATNTAGAGQPSAESNGVVPVKATSTILSSSTNPSPVGAPVTFTATVTGNGPTGTVTFMDGADTLDTVTLTGDHATFTISTLTEGPHAITAFYGGDGGNGASLSFALRQSVNRHTGVIAIAAGSYHTAALKSDGSVVAWGFNYSGQTTIPATARSGVIAIAAGGSHTAALKSDGSVIAWGLNNGGQATIPAEASSGVIAIATGAGHTVALKTDGSLAAWGWNGNGQTTIPAAASSGVVAIAAGGGHTVALRNDGSVIAWGSNYDGQATVPAAATSGVVAIAAGAKHTAALKRDGSVVAWGYNYYGQTTVPVAATAGIVAIAAGETYTAALKSDGSVVVWGSGGVTTVPAEATSGVIAIAAGANHMVALRSDGAVIAWGYNSDGQTAVPSFTVAVNPSGPVAAGEAVRFSWSAGGIDCVWDGASISGACNSLSIIATTRVELTAALSPNTFVDTWGTGCDAVTGTTCIIDSLAAGVTISPVTAAGTVVVPSAPIIGVATAGDSTAHVSFDPPPSNGGGTIWWYTVTSSGGQSATGSSSPITVRGLTNGTAYTFNVTATNTAGTGPPSEESSSVVPRNPTITILSASPNPALGGAPVTFTATVLGNNPTGTVVFMNGADGLGTAELSGTRATFATSILGEGQHAITALYGGDAVNGPSTSLVLQQNVSRYSGVIAIAAGYAHSVGLKSDGSVIAWGDNYRGQTMVPVAARSGVTAIAAGYEYTVALKSDGSVIAWGDNSQGQTTVPAEATSGVVAIAAGFRHTVALKSDGSVIAWGENFSGQTTIPAAATSGVIAIAAGADHTVALKSDGSVIAWGENFSGQTTIPAAATSGVIAVAAGYQHTVALKSDGSVIAWGENYDGRTTIPPAATSGVIAIAAGQQHTVALKGDGSVIAWGYSYDGRTTVPAAATSGVIAIAAGGGHTLALKGDGSLIAWGANSNGQSTVSSFVVSVAPTGSVPAGDSVVFTGNANGIDCAWDGTATSGSCSSVPLIKGSRVVLTTHLPAGTFVDSWGPGCAAMTPTTCTIENLGADMTLAPNVAVGTPAVPDAPILVSAVAGDTRAMVRFSPPPSDGGGTIWSYTVTSSGGQSATGSSSPILVSGLANFVSYTFTATATNAAGTGPASEPSNSVTPLPHTTILASSANPVLLGAPVTFTAIVLGTSPTGTVTFKDGEDVLGSGSLEGGRAAFTTTSLGLGFHTISATYGGDGVNPVSVSNALQQAVTVSPGVIAISAGGYHTAALKSDGSVVAWGNNYYGQTTVPAAATSGVVAVAAGSSHTTALKSDGSVVAWGYNYHGQTTVPSAATSGVIAIAAGYRHSVALKGDGSVIAWGYNNSGQTTIPAAATSGVIAIAAGYSHTVALKNDGSVIAWGDNTYGQASVPTAATFGVVAIAADSNHTLALKSDGSAIAWGYHFSGEATVPAAATSGVVAVAAGGRHSLALKDDGSVIAWGWNGDGQTTVPEAATSGVIAVSAGERHSVVLKDDGTVLAWGFNDIGQPYSTVSVALAGPTAPGQTVTVTSDVGGIDCTWGGTTASGSCTSAPILAMTRVVLTAHIPPNTFVDSWGIGCDATTATTCTINSLTADTTISPVTDLRHYLAVNVLPAAGGTVTAEGIDCPGTCSGMFVGLSPVANLLATPAAGYVFLRWEGDASGASPSLDLPMTSDKSVTAIFSTSLTVCPDGCDFADIQQAVDTARTGDVILIGPGTVKVNLAVGGAKEFTLRGTGVTPAGTVLDGDTDPAIPGGDGSVVSVAATEGVQNRVRIENLTLTGGKGPCGGGLHLEADGTGDLGVSLAQVVIRLNSAAGGTGGGICARATGGGSLALDLENVMVVENRASLGGGIHASAVDDGSTVQLAMMNATVAGSTAGGGTHLSASANGALSAVLVNSILAGDNSAVGTDLSIVQSGGGAAVVDASFSDVRSYLVESGTLNWGGGMRSGSPVFRSPAKGDFHLNADSPCVDRGTGGGAPAKDYEGNGRPQGGGVDIGADECRPVSYPRLRLLSLTGGERVAGGRPYDITWGAPATLVRFKVYVSSNGGKTWTLKATKGRRSRHYTWTPPRVTRSIGTYRVKVEGYGADNALIWTVRSTSNITVRRR